MEQDVSSGFSSRLRNLRESRSYRQDDIAELFGMNKSAVSQWENGRIPHPTIVAKLADFFNVSTDFLLCRTNDPQGIQEKLATPEDFAGETIGETVSTIALSRSDNPDDDLPEEAQKQIEEFRAYIRQKYKKPE